MSTDEYGIKSTYALKIFGIGGTNSTSCISREISRTTELPTVVWVSGIPVDPSYALSSLRKTKRKKEKGKKKKEKKSLYLVLLYRLLLNGKD